MASNPVTAIPFLPLDTTPAAHPPIELDRATAPQGQVVKITCGSH